jgi:hypothetical protein
MSIVINVSIDGKENKNTKERISRPISRSIIEADKVNKGEQNSNYEDDFVTLSDKSIINLPKYLRANSNDLNKINIVITEASSPNIILSKNGTGVMVDYKASTNDREETSMKNEKEVYSSHIRINSSFISTISEKKKSSNREKNLSVSNYKDCYEQKVTQQTFSEKNVYDEINRAEALKCVDNMEYVIKFFQNNL